MLKFENLIFGVPGKGKILVNGIIGNQECVVLTGPTGCGKTTLLRVIAGLEAPESGSIFFGEKKLTGLPPQEIKAGLVFQDSGLWPDLNIKKNLSYGFKFHFSLSRLEPTLVEEKIQKAAQFWGIEKLLERFPSNLSGGEKQSVAFVRTLLIDPPFFLLDESWSALDLEMRQKFLAQFKNFLNEKPKPTLWVSHHSEDLTNIATRIVAWDVRQQCISF